MIKKTTFLKDVLICSLGAYGGPEAHYGVFTDQMVIKKKYLDEHEMIELIALTGILPGPSSTQTIISIGYKVGGPVLALLTMLVWSLPAIIIMTLLSFLYAFLSRNQIDQNVLRFIGPMAVGFIVLAAYRLSRKVVKDNITLGLFLLALLVTYFIRDFYIFPLLLLTGGLVAVYTAKETDLWHKVSIKPKWRYMIIFLTFAIGSFLLSYFIDHILLYLFDAFYRFGYMVIGGGQVVIPYMYEDLVTTNQFMTTDQFLTGFGLVQGMPGPMFSFSAYAGGLASSTDPWTQIFGALLSGLGIFLPGVLLIFFVYPIWVDLREIKGIKVALKGITAIAAGLILSSGIVLFMKHGVSWVNGLVLIITVLMLLKKIPAPLIVLLMVAFGFIFL
jgi:chromate transporter